jgi:mRNA interferase MazF
MTAYSFGDVVLVPFPFADTTETKKRPAVVISSDRYHEAHLDLLLMAITGNPEAQSEGLGFPIEGWRQAGLLNPSAVKPVIATVHPSRVIRTLGRLRGEDLDRLHRLLRDIVG